MLRGLLLVYSVLIAQAGEAGQQAVAAFGQAVRYAGKASSCVGGLNSVVRMQQSRHRKMSQGLVDLKRLSFRAQGVPVTEEVSEEGLPKLIVTTSLQCRGDWTPLELFIAGVRGWEAGLRRRLDDGT
jgi:hypothetical protein